MRRTQTSWTCENCGKEEVKEHRVDPPSPPACWLEVGPMDIQGRYTHLCSWPCVKRYAERMGDPLAKNS